MPIEPKNMTDEDDKVLLKTLEEFTGIANKTKKVVASIPDFYEALKNDEIFDINGLITSTVIKYTTNSSTKGSIIHYYGSEVIPQEEIACIIPLYDKINLDKVLESDLGYIFLKNLFKTSDKRETIKETLNKITRNLKEDPNFVIYTSNKDRRRKTPLQIMYISILGVGGLDYSIKGQSRAKAITPIENPNYNKLLLIEKNDSFFDLDLNIDANNECVCFTNTQETDKYQKYLGVFYFFKKRFVVSLTIPFENSSKLMEWDNSINTLEWDKTISTILKESDSTDDKLKNICAKLSPIYGHIMRCEPKEGIFDIVDDSEYFDNPRKIEQRGD